MKKFRLLILINKNNNIKFSMNAIMNNKISKRYYNNNNRSFKKINNSNNKNNNYNKAIQSKKFNFNYNKISQKKKKNFLLWY